MIRSLMIGLVSLVGLAGCETIIPDVSAPLGHPANPHSKQARPIAVSRALDEKVNNDDPYNRGHRKTPVPEDHSGHQMQMHKH